MGTHGKTSGQNAPPHDRAEQFAMFRRAEDNLRQFIHRGAQPGGMLMAAAVAGTHIGETEARQLPFANQAPVRSADLEATVRATLDSLHRSGDYPEIAPTDPHNMLSAMTPVGRVLGDMTMNLARYAAFRNYYYSREYRESRGEPPPSEAIRRSLATAPAISSIIANAYEDFLNRTRPERFNAWMGHPGS